MQTLTLKIPADLAGWLEGRARELGRSKSDIAREALAAQRQKSGRESVTARAGNLVGRFASGRKDSSHKKHLKGFGSCRRS
jgi:predicted transcriptional regulator